MIFVQAVLNTSPLLKKLSFLGTTFLCSFLIQACQTNPAIYDESEEERLARQIQLDVEKVKELISEENKDFKETLKKNLIITIRNEIVPELREISTYSNNIVARKQKKLKGKVFKKTVIGRVEWITVLDPDAKFRARVDTGAQTCSLHAENIKEKTINDKLYVEFTSADDDGTKHTFLKEVIKTTIVKSTSGKSEKRYVVRLDFKFGNETVSANVNLNNRSSLRHNFLIGRNLLLGNYIVDVSQSRLLGE